MWCTMEYYPAIRKDKRLPFARTWMDLENTVLSDVNERGSEELCDFTHMWDRRLKLTGTDNNMVVTRGKRGGG